MKYLLRTMLLLLLSLNAVQANDLNADELVKMIQKGGYVIYLRHAATDHSQQDVDRKNLEDCGTQRNLSDQGRQQSLAIGAGFKVKNIPVGKVITSPWCRAKDTAYLGFGRAEIFSDLGFSISKNAEDKQRLSKVLNKMLSELPASGANTILISHTSNLKEAAGIWPKNEASMAVFEPDTSVLSGYKYHGMISPDYWLDFSEN